MSIHEIGNNSPRTEASDHTHDFSVVINSTTDIVNGSVTITLGCSNSGCSKTIIRTIRLL